MAKYVQINSVPNGSTGSVMRRVQAERIAAGDECWMMWGRGRAAENNYEFNFGTKMGLYADVVQTRLDGKAGFHSKSATKRLLAKLDKIQPDVVHLHNIHGYYINIEMLFGWLAAHDCHVNWTLHDCWAFTGHCAYEQPCCQLDAYPKTISKASVSWNFEYKKKLFTMLPSDRMTLVSPSQWLADLVAESFLAKYPVEVRHNTVEADVFKPTPSDFRERYGIGDRFMILGVASPWTERKGLDDFVRLSQELDGDKFAIVLVGLDKKQIKTLKDKLVADPRVDDPKKLANTYSVSDVFVGPSIEETYGITAAEANACGARAVAMGSSAYVEAGRPELLDVMPVSFEELNAVVVRLRAGVVVLMERTESRKQLAALYSAADIFFNPTREDNYPTVNLEAEACGLPVWTYDTGGCRETVGRQDSLLIYTVSDAARLLTMAISDNVHQDCD